MPPRVCLNRAKGSVKLHMPLLKVAYATWQSCICDFRQPYRGFNQDLTGI